MEMETVLREDSFVTEPGIAMMDRMKTLVVSNSDSSEIYFISIYFSISGNIPECVW